MPSEGTTVFVSYSHADASLVAPVVKLLRVNKSLVFQDIYGISQASYAARDLGVIYDANGFHSWARRRWMR